MKMHGPKKKPTDLY